MTNHPYRRHHLPESAADAASPQKDIPQKRNNPGKAANIRGLI